MSEILTRAAAFAPNTFDAEKRTVQVVFSTGAEMARADWEGPYTELLSMAPAAVNLSELIGGPVLDNHDRFSGVHAVLGVVDAASVDGERGVATIRFSERPEVAGVMKDVATGIVRNVSVGYTVQEWKIEKRADGTRIKTATKWTPKEISLTALAGDRGATTRSDNMNPELQEQIRNIATAVGVATGVADDLIGRNATLEDARRAIITEAARQGATIDARLPATITRDAGDGIVTRMADGLLARVNPNHKPEQGREFAYIRIPDIARRCLELRGLSVLGSPVEILTRAMHTTSDFSAVLAEVFQKNLLILGAAPAAITQVFRRATAPDFRNRHILEVSDGPGLSKVAESGEVTFGSISDKELAAYKVDSYAKGFAISFRALVNDDVNALSDISSKMSRGARTWFASFLVDTIIGNPKLADNKAVFHTDHGNLAAGHSEPDDESIADGKMAIRLQTDLSGNPLNIAPRFIVAAVANENNIDRLLAALYPAMPETAAVAARTLTPIVDARFDLADEKIPWYLFCDPALAPVFEYSELQGYEGARVEVRQGFQTLGTEARVVWHVGAGAIDHRGAYKYPGA